MLKIAIILGSTRPNRIGEGVARWVYDIAARRTDAHYDLIDLKDQNLPLLDEPAPPSLGQYSQPHTKAWAAKIIQYDGFVFVTAEYNHGIPGALKNAIDYLYKEWNNKAAGIVSYGSAYGARSSSPPYGLSVGCSCQRTTASRCNSVICSTSAFNGDLFNVNAADYVSY